MKLKKRKKCLVIYASPNSHGNTESSGKTVCRVLREHKISYKKLVLRDLHIDHCKGMRKCRNNGKCVIRDDMLECCREIEGADMIIVLTPVYFYSVPSKMKAFIDRCQVFWERKYYKDTTVIEKSGFFVISGEMKSKDIFECVEKVISIFYRTIKTKISGKYCFRNELTEPKRLQLEKRLRKFVKSALN